MKRSIFRIGPRSSMCAVAAAAWLVGPLAAQQTGPTPPSGVLPAVRSVAEFLPADFAKDGSQSYQPQLQKAIDQAAAEGVPLIFPAATYKLDAKGLALRTGSNLSLHGARFEVDADSRQDGQAFLGRDVTNVRLSGGEIIGHNETWPEGVNIRGIHLVGKVSGVHIEGTQMRELSSTGIGVFGNAEELVRDVWVSDVVVDHCCNQYGDYLDAKSGPEPGSKRDDQGLICFYYVRDFVVRGCRFENSRSDGTHFYFCRQGHFTDNRVYGAKMGGYFLESCSDVTATGCAMLSNGSRGVTIERGSKRCTMQNCLVADSGREGLWAPDCSGLVISGNIFDRNGRKAGLMSASGGTENHTANICIDEDGKEPTHSPTENYLVVDNLIYTTAEQRAAIRVLASVSTGIVLKNNLLRGANVSIAIEGEPSTNVISQGNEE